MDSPGEQDVERLYTGHSARTLEHRAFRSEGMREALKYTMDPKDWVSASDYDRLQAEVAALKELLRKYGRHMISCDVVMLPGVDQCTCGYGAALARGGQG